MKVVINAKYGGFSLSHAAFLRLRELGCEVAKNEPDYGEFWDDGSGPRRASSISDSFCRDIPRNDPALLQVVDELGDAANGMCAKLKIIEIPDDIEWEIDEYDGFEKVVERHRSWS